MLNQKIKNMMNAIAWNNKYSLCAIFSLFLISFSSIAQKPAPPQSKSILILGSTAHLGNGEVIQRSAVGFRNGKIDLVMSVIDARLDSTKYDSIIHLPKKHLYPGFIAPNSRLGLVEIEAVRASRDFDDVGLFNPHVRSLTAYNTDSRITPTVRTNGILIAEVAPKGGRISGSSSVFELDGWNWEDAVVKKDAGIHLNWPSFPIRGNEESKKHQKELDSYQEQLKEIERFFQEAKAYGEVEFHLESNLRFEAMKAVFNQKAKVFVHANRVQEITDAMYFFDDFDFDFVLVGGYESWMVAELLKDREIPIVLRRVHSLPMQADEPIDLPYRLPKILSDKGLLVALENSGRMEAMGTRNLPFYAGTAAAYGVDKEEALSMISLNTAKILGIEQRLGSIEVGKDATLFISEGDALDMRGNHVLLAFIQGRQLILTNDQLKLYEKYLGKE